MEIPQPPPYLVQRLQEHDKSLGLRFNVDERLWEVTEITKTGHTSHCFYWHDGDWKNRKYKPLPLSAEPLLTKLGIIDWGRGGVSPRERYEALKASGQEKRAERMRKAHEEGRKRFAAYAEWSQRNMEGLQRLHRMGGASRARAVRARDDAALEILYDGKHPKDR